MGIIVIGFIIILKEILLQIVFVKGNKINVSIELSNLKLHEGYTK